MESQVNTAIVARLQATDPTLLVQDSGHDQSLAGFLLRLLAVAASPFAALSFAALFAALPLQLCTRSLSAAALPLQLSLQLCLLQLALFAALAFAALPFAASAFVALSLRCASAALFAALHLHVR